MFRVAVAAPSASTKGAPRVVDKPARGASLLLGPRPRNMVIDETDRSILSLLQQDARIANAEIGRQVGLVPSAIFRRIRKLEEQGVIRGYTTLLDPAALGYTLLAFVRVQTAPRPKATEATRQLAGIPQVSEVHRVVGEDCFFLKVRVQGPKGLEELLNDVLEPLPSVASTRTTIVLSTGKETLTVPILRGDRRFSRNLT